MDFKSISKLSQSGADLMTRYSYTGFNVICNKIGDKEKDISHRMPNKVSFLRTYYNLLESYLD